MSQQIPLGNLTPDEKRALLAKLLKEKASQTVITVPASDGQRALYVVNSLSPQSHAYNIAFSVRIRSALDAEMLKQAAQILTDRHAALRTTYALRDGDLLQNIVEWQEPSFTLVNAAGWSEETLFQQVTAAFRQPFDLIKGPVARWHLFRRDAADFVWMFSVHHIAIDAWSLGVLLAELRLILQALTRGEKPQLPPIPPAYTAWTRWQADLLAGAEGDRLKTYWMQELSGDLPGLNLIPDFPRPTEAVFQGSSVSFTLPAGQTHRIKALAQAEGVTLYMLLLATFQTLLHRYTGQEEVVVGTPTSGRGQEDYNTTIGYFVNPVALRGRMEGNPTFRQLLARTRQSVVGALQHQDYPFSRVVQHLESRPEPGRSPVFQCMFNLLKSQPGDLSTSLALDQSAKPVDFGGMQFYPYLLRQQEGQFELTLDVVDGGETLAFILNYQTDLFHRETIARLARSFERLLAGVLETPAAPISALPVLAQDERDQILHAWNQTQTEYPRHLRVHQLFEAQVERTPDAAAVTFAGQTLTYRQLNQRANQLAHRLRELGAGPDQMVGVFLERSLEMVITVLGVMKSGAAYIPMDPIFPAQRIGYMLEDSRAPVIVTQSSLVDSLPPQEASLVLLDEDTAKLDRQPLQNPDPLGDPESLAYVIFTSGSTGRPKGVQISHRALVNFLLSMQIEPGITPADVLASVTTLSFDIAGLELYLPLISGARLVVLSADTAADGVALAEALEQSAATILQATPATWRLLVETGWAGRANLKMLCGGEPLPQPLARQLLALGGELWNMYGPTETTIWSTICRVTLDDPTISIGRPIANTQVYILDAGLQPVPVGVTGSLYIGGDGLAHGYLGRDDLTREKFITLPQGGGSLRIYNTGDLARYLPDGRIECLGRGDSQVKIRGFRIELGEIEAVLGQHPALSQAVVMVREDTPGDKRLAAYFTAAAEAVPTTRELRNFLREKLPSYMIPSAYIPMDAFPLTPNGKINRRALPAPEQSAGDVHHNVQPPVTAAEQIIAAAWQKALKVSQISVFDNFFDLGGYSLLAMQVVVDIQEKTGVRIEPVYLRIESLGQLALTLEAKLALKETPE